MLDYKKLKQIIEFTDTGCYLGIARTLFFNIAFKDVIPKDTYHINNIACLKKSYKYNGEINHPDFWKFDSDVPLNQIKVMTAKFYTTGGYRLNYSRQAESSLKDYKTNCGIITNAEINFSLDIFTSKVIEFVPFHLTYMEDNLIYSSTVNKIYNGNDESVLFDSETYFPLRMKIKEDVKIINEFRLGVTFYGNVYFQI